MFTRLYRSIYAKKRSLLVLALSAGLLAQSAAWPGSAKADDPQPIPPSAAVAGPQKPAYVDGEVIVRFKKNKLRTKSVAGAKSKHRLSVKKELPTVDAEVMQIGTAESVADVVSSLKASGEVELAQPNYMYYPRADAPNDPQWTNLWGLSNTGQSIFGVSGVPGVDIGALGAWDYTATRAQAAVMLKRMLQAVGFINP